MVGSRPFQILLHRQSPTDDDLGLGERLIDSTFVEHTFHIEIGELERSEYLSRILSIRMCFGIQSRLCRRCN